MTQKLGEEGYPQMTQMTQIGRRLIKTGMLGSVPPVIASLLLTPDDLRNLRNLGFPAFRGGVSRGI